MLDEDPESLFASACSAVFVIFFTAICLIVQCGGKKNDKTTDASSMQGDQTGKNDNTKKTETQTPSMMSHAKDPTTSKNPTASVCQSQVTKTQQQTSQYNTTGDPQSTQQPSKKPGTVTDDGGYDNLNPNSKPMSGPI